MNDLIYWFNTFEWYVLTGFQPDVVMLDMFRTEFQLVFMWGSQGVATDIAQRYCKFEQVLHAFSEQWEPSLVEREQRWKIECDSLLPADAIHLLLHLLLASQPRSSIW